MGGMLYYDDIWSNLHYGYVGMACGFSESTLFDGAGLEQIGSDLLRLDLPTSDDGVTGLDLSTMPATARPLPSALVSSLERLPTKW